VGDEVYFFVDTAHLPYALDIFGCTEIPLDYVLMFGGGSVGFQTAKALEADSDDTQITLLERDKNRAGFLAEHLKRSLVIHGDGFDDTVLDDLDLRANQVSIATTQSDENNVLLSLNLTSEAIKWSVDPAVSKIPIILLSIWSSLGYILIIYMAAIENVPRSLYEAATIDGASTFTQFMKITVPLISPTTFYLIIVRMIAVFKIFSSVNVFTMGSSITSNTSIVQEIYSSAFSNYEHGYASAQSVVLLAIILIITAIQFWGQKKWVHY
jgi:hypothetical protein